ncbi:MAG: energy coupling factor transporter S component ThiW [Oscillospiraceae bacterium]|nr:energy coupling factor transporter S component ThiW [Oscillospiraceae bacterium]
MYETFKRSDYVKTTQIKKMALASLLAAVAVVLSPLSIPVGASKCFPIQHLVNVIAGVFLGPWYAMGSAFITSLIRNIMGTGSLLAFPGSMCGAFLCGLLFSKTKNLIAGCLGEVIGTGIIGGLLAYPVATMIMGKEAALFAYVMPFLTATMVGSFMALLLIGILDKSGAFRMLQKMVN